MTVNAGDSVGQYEIIEQIGVGGMGEVFSAKDTRLGRKVAIKFLPAELSGNADRLARFVQEAKTACPESPEHHHDPRDRRT